MQELFTKLDFDSHPEHLDYYPLARPFDLWNRKWQWRTVFNPDSLEIEQAVQFLRSVHGTAASRSAKAFGFKVLSNHFKERLFLLPILKEFGYRCLYLRRNPVMQVISGMTANLTSVYNTKRSVTSDWSVELDKETFSSLLRWETHCVGEDLAFLKLYEIPFIEVHYEHFLDNRQAFFSGVFDFLGLNERSVPPRSEFQVIIQDRNRNIRNMDEILQCARDLGFDPEWAPKLNV
jgi:hypothetical protein